MKKKVIVKKKKRIKKIPPRIPKGKIINNIRRLFYYSKLRRDVAKRSEIPETYIIQRKRKVKGKRKLVDIKMHFHSCEKCGAKVKKVEIDHIIPAVSIELGWQGYDKYIERLFCDDVNLWGLCEECHSKKTSDEQILRQVFKKEKEEI